MQATRKIDECASDFPSLRNRYDGQRPIYLDGPGGTQTPRSVNAAIVHYLETCNSNIHGNFRPSRESDAVLSQAREAVADFLGAPSGDSISVGPNMTTLCFALSRALGATLNPGDEIVISDLDHEANRGPWLNLESRGARIRRIPLLQNGTLDESVFEELVNDRTRVVALGLSSNALGTVNNVALARDLCRQFGAYLVLDAVHFAPHCPIDVATLDCDFLLCSAYKFYGPHVGYLYSRHGLLDQLEPERLRSQDSKSPYRIETGTQNHEGLMGTTAAIDYLASFGDGHSRRKRLASGMRRIEKHELDLAQRFYDELERMDGVRVYGPEFGVGPRTPTVAFTVDDTTPDEVARHLARDEIYVWDGDFAAMQAVETLGLSERGGLVRVGLSIYNSMEDVEATIEILRAIIRSKGRAA